MRILSPLRVLPACILLMLVVTLHAQKPLMGYHHEAWTADRGLGAVFDVQQAPDGFLWLTTSRGVYRFDGVRLQTVEAVTRGAANTRDLDSAYVSPSGAVWFVTRAQGLLLWKDEKLTSYSDRRCTPGRKLESFAEDKEGALWMLASGGIFRLNQGKCEEAGKAFGLGGMFARAMLITRDGTLWLKTQNGDLVFLSPGSKQLEVKVRGRQPVGEFNFLHEGPDGSVWLSDFTGLRRVSGPGAPRPSTVMSEPPKDETMLGNFTFGDDGALWTSARGAILRFEHPQQSAIGKALDPKQATAFTTTDGLSSDVVSKLFVDREGTLWTATNGGLDQLRRNAITALPIPPGIDFQIGVVPGDHGSIWLGGRGRPLTLMRADGTSRIYPETEQVLALRRDRNGVLWSGGRAKQLLWRVEGERATAELSPDGDVDPPAAMAVDKNNELWVSTFHPQIYHRVGGKWLPESDLIGRKPGVLGAMTADVEGNVWFAFSNKLVEWDGKAYQRFTVSNAEQNISVTTMATRSGRVWLGGTGGIVLFRDGRFARLHFQDEDLLGRVSGLVETAGGELWANGFSGVARVPSAELQHFFADPKYAVHAEHFDTLDGLPGLSQERYPEPTITETPDGRLYFATTRGVGWLDPRTLDAHRNHVPPPVMIEEVLAGGVEYSATHALRLPPRTDRVELRYAALSLVLPERVRFRYRLEPLDKEWQEAGTRREAFYNSLPPGHYRFRVTASNNDGIWNETGAMAEFTIAPAFYQTLWFYALFVVALVGGVYLLFFVRMRRLTGEMQRRMDERATERVRIARELHDTLLQTIHALMLRFHFAVESLPPDEPARALLEQSLARADGAIVETRQRVQDLRTATMQALPFHQMIERMADDLRTEEVPTFTVTVEGAVRAFAPLVQDELCQIAQEAMTNAFRHAEASHIRFLLVFGLGAFRMSYRDDGRGMEPDVLTQGGRDGHWGLVGMRERARAIGADFEIRSTLGEGTEILLRVPAMRAYADSRRRGLWDRIASLFRISKR